MKFIDEARLVFGELFFSVKDLLELRWRFQVVKAKLAKEYRELERLEDYGDGFIEYRYQGLRNDEIWFMHMQSQILLEMAEKLRVKITTPAERPDFYEQVEWDLDDKEPHYLNNEGLKAITPIIQDALKQKRDAWAFRVAVFVGCVGSLTGLVSVFK